MPEVENIPPSRGKLEEYIESHQSLRDALKLATAAHEGQTRAEGVPYITHCVEVAKIIYEEWGIEDENILSAALLHDTIEDTLAKDNPVTYQHISQKFGTHVADLVDGVSKFRSEKSLSKEEGDRETIRKVFDRNLVDPVVGVLKLADRLHNMRTLTAVAPEKKLPKARETIDNYAPLAESLGMWVVKRELEELSLPITDPEVYQAYKNLFDSDPRTNRHFIASLSSDILEYLGSNHVDCDVETRINSIARIKEKAKKMHFKQLDDIVSFRVVVNQVGREETRDATMKALALIWEKYKDISDPKRFDNFYFKPRENEYSAFQVTLNTSAGPVKVAITSREKEDYNNWGIVSLIKKGEGDLKNHALKLIRTPSGEVKFFAQGARGIDFAYAISEKMGAQATGVLIDGEPADISKVLPNGTTVEVLLGEDRIAPEPEAVTNALPATMTKIRQQFLEKETADLREAGKQAVSRIIQKRGILNLFDLLKLEEHSTKVVSLLYSLGCKRDLGKLYLGMGSGLISMADLEKELDDNHLTKGELGLTSIIIEGSDNPAILQTFAGEISRLGGNIRRNYGGSNRGVFTEHFVVENLSSDDEKKLRDKISQNPQVAGFLVV